MPSPLIIGITGLSSAGKTTLSRLLASVFPGTHLLHQDDFFLTDAQIPLTPVGTQNWDCPGAIDWEGFVRALTTLKRTGDVVVVDSLESQVPHDDAGVPEAVVAEAARRVSREFGGEEGVAEGLVAVVDGFLLLSDDRVVDLLDVGFFLRGKYETSKARRAARSYNTVEGYWTDPPGYWDEIVWPNFIENFKHLFLTGDPEGELNREILTQHGLHSPDISWSLDEIVPWMVDIVVQELKRRKENKST